MVDDGDRLALSGCIGALRQKVDAVPVAVLSARLCAEPGLAIWCRALPATFGADAAGAADDGYGKDGER